MTTLKNEGEHADDANSGWDIVWEWGTSGYMRNIYRRPTVLGLE